LELKDRFGAKVIVGTMGPPNAAEVLRASLYRGADECVLLTDRSFAGADTLATSYALSCCAKKLGNFDLVLCGRQAIDGDTAQVGPQLAEKLDIPQLAYIEDVIDLTKKKITVKRSIEGGYEVLESPTPALLTVVDSNEPRPAAARRMMKYKKARTLTELNKEHNDDDYTESEALASEQEKLEANGLLIHEWSAAYVGAEIERIGLKGSPTKVKQIQSVILTAGDAKQIEPTDKGVNDLIHELIEDHTLG